MSLSFFGGLPASVFPETSILPRTTSDTTVSEEKTYAKGQCHNDEQA